jgi:hypothetical protein
MTTLPRKLRLRRETLAELTPDELRDVVGAQGTQGTSCVSVFFAGCPSNPQVCHYVTDFC